MTRALRALALPLIFLWLWPLPAAAESEELSRYTIDAVVPQDGRPPRYQVTLAYRAPAGAPKQRGFKYFAKEPLEDLRVTDENDAPLQHDLSLERSSSEYRLDFSVPPPGRDRLQTVRISFTQQAVLRHVLRGRSLEVPWAHKFRIPVSMMRVVLDLPGAPPGLQLDDFGCSESPTGRTCIRVTGSAAPLRVLLPLAQTSLALPALVLLTAAAGIALALQRRRARVLAERGILPPASREAYPAPGSTPYRAPPPLPPQQQPVLAEDDRRALRTAAWLSALIPLALLCGLALFLDLIGTPMPAPQALAMGAGLLALGTIFALLAKEPLRVLKVLWAGPSIVAGAVGGLPAFLVVLFISFFIYMAISHAGGMSGGGGGSDSGGSSCGGGGGSSCGGGGGGCGGGGGGCGG